MDAASLFLTGGVALVSSVITAIVTVRLQGRIELRKWQREARLVAIKAQADANYELANRIAQNLDPIGVIRIVGDGEKYFVGSASRLTLGRGRNCDIIVNKAPLSRQAAEIFADRGKVYVRDLGSRNGIVVNSQMVTSAIELHDGDTIRCGEPIAVYHRLMK